MTTWATTNFAGGAVGAAATELTEPIFYERTGSGDWPHYGVATTGGSGQSLENNSVTGSLAIALAGRTHVRLAVDIERVSGTISAGVLLIQLRSGITNRADLFLRNANGGNLACRVNFAYLEQSAVVFGNGSLAHIEFEWTNGVGVDIHVFYAGNATTTPDEILSGPMTLSADNINIGNGGSSTGLLTRIGQFRMTDGEQYRVAPGGVETGYVAGMTISDAENAFYASQSGLTGPATATDHKYAFLRATTGGSGSMADLEQLLYAGTTERAYWAAIAGISPYDQYSLNDLKMRAFQS